MEIKVCGAFHTKLANEVYTFTSILLLPIEGSFHASFQSLTSNHS